MKRSFVFLALIIFVLSAGRAVQAADPWISVRSKNFNLIGNAAEKDIRIVATKLEQFRETFRLLFPGLKVDSSIKTTVIVFKNGAAYRSFKPRRPDGKPDDGIAGYFQPGDDINYITLSIDGGVQDTLGTIFHEYTHFMLDTSVGKANIPAWFNEGMAEYYQTFKIAEDQKVTLGDIQNNHLALLQQTKLIPFDQFFGADNYSLHANGDATRNVFYAQAWALMHYLMQGNGGANREKLDRFFSLLLKETAPEAAFRLAFNSDYATLEKELRAYVEKNKYMATVYTLPQKLVFDTQMAVAPMSEEMANAHLGDLLLHIRAYADAEAQLNKTLSADPDNSMANTSMGLVKMRQRNFPEAKKYLERAIAADRGSHFANYNYALVLSREAIDEFGYIQKFAPDSVTKMRAALSRAIAIDPKFSESYRLLAFIGLVNGDNLDEALKNVSQALAIKPGDPSYMLLAAKILLRQEKLDDAKTIAERVSKAADEKETKAEAEGLIRSIQQIAESKAAYEKQMAENRARLQAQGLDLRPSSKPPLILKRKDLTDEQVAKYEKDREIANINRMLPAAREGESRVLGSIESIACPQGAVRFNVRTAQGKLVLTAVDFQSLPLTIFKEGTQNFEIGCGADLSRETLVVTYKALQKPTLGLNGELVAGSFVPSDFRFMSEEELANMPYVIIEGAPPTDLAKNARLAEEEQSDFEKKRREMMIRQIQQSLREPLAGEQRLIGTVEKVECAGPTMSALVSTEKGQLKLRVTTPQALRLMVYTPDIPSMRFGCGEAYPNVKAVVTFGPSTDGKKFAGELKALEFVPASFTLQ